MIIYCTISVKYWADPVRYPQIPVRAVAKGQRTKDDGTVVDFLHYYEYINFKTTIDDPSVFEVSFSGPSCSKIVSLTCSLVVKMLTVLVSIISNSQIFLQKKM